MSDGRRAGDRRGCPNSPAADVHLKLENLQETGSFKLRGVVNKILSLSAEQSRPLLVAASTGKPRHGIRPRRRTLWPEREAVHPAYGLEGQGGAPPRYRDPFEMVGENCVEAEQHAHAFARDGGHVWVSPYNDPDVVAGQGTVAVELTTQLEDFDTVLVPVGGGGLIAGIAVVPQDRRPGNTGHRLPAAEFVRDGANRSRREKSSRRRKSRRSRTERREVSRRGR